MSGRVLALDYGTKRMGYALSDPTNTIVSIKNTILIKSSQFLWEQLGLIINNYGINSIVVGYPLQLDGSKGERVAQVEKFINKIKSKWDVTIITWDERYTSIMAREKNMYLNKKKRRDKSLIDSTAAAIMLEEFINSKYHEV